MAADPSLLGLLKRMRERSGASLAECREALKVAQDNPRLALNALASMGYTGGREPYDESAPLGSYRFDAYARRVVDASISAICEDLRPGGAPITAVVLHAQLGIAVSLAFVYDVGRIVDGAAKVTVEIAEDLGGIPVDQRPDDPLLETFRYRFGFQETRPDVGLFEEDPALRWEESSLPEAVYVYEMLRASQEITRRLAEAGRPVAEGCVAAYGRHDFLVDDLDDQRALIRSGLRTHMGDPGTLRAFASLCYGSLEGQQHLIELT